MTDFNLAVGVLNNITEEFEQLFDPNKISDFSYQYVSTLDEKYKKQRGNCYTSDMRRCDIKIHVKPEITSWLIIPEHDRNSRPSSAGFCKCPEI